MTYTDLVRAEGNTAMLIFDSAESTPRTTEKVK
jgi:hypothetical protein